MTLEHIDRFSWIFWNYHFKSKENIDIHYRNSRWLSITKCPRIPMCDAYSSNLAGNLFLKVSLTTMNSYATTPTTYSIGALITC